MSPFLHRLPLLLLLLWLHGSQPYSPPTPITPENPLWQQLRFSPESRGAFERHGLSAAQWELLEAMARSHAMWNERINVVSRKDIENLISRHYLPSLAIMNLFDSPNGEGYEPADGAATTAAAASLESLEASTVVQLKELLRGRGLPVSGRKAELISRLVANQDGGGGEEAEATTANAAATAAAAAAVRTTMASTLCGASLLDVGTGGGFPGLPLAAACPEAHFTLVDSRSKKLEVVRAIVDELQLPNVEVVHGRVEDLRTKRRDKHPHTNRFDFVLGRAVTALPAFVSWVEPYLEETGRGGDTKAREWGLERGILYVKSDTRSGDLGDIGLRPSDVTATTIDHLLLKGGRMGSRQGAVAASEEGPRDELGAPLGYSAVVHIPSERLLSPGASQQRKNRAFRNHH